MIRFQNSEAHSAIDGLLDIGDEILEINGQHVQGMALDDVYKLMTEKVVTVMKILPKLARNDC